MCEDSCEGCESLEARVDELAAALQRLERSLVHSQWHQAPPWVRNGTTEWLHGWIQGRVSAGNDLRSVLFEFRTL